MHKIITLDTLKTFKDLIMSAINKIQTDLTKTVNNATSTVETTSKKLDNFIGRNMIVIGDSYSQAYSPDGVVKSWTEKFKELYRPSSLINCSYGGVGFAYTVDNKNFLSLIKSVTVEDPNSITDVIFAGGYNDQFASSRANIEEGARNCIQYVKDTFPNAKIYIACLGWSKNAEKQNVISTHVLPAYKNGTYFGSEYLSRTEYTMHDLSLFASDGIHPNQNGQNEIAKNMYLALTGKLSVNKPFINDFIRPLSGVSLDTMSIGQLYDNGRLSIICVGSEITFSSVKAFTCNPEGLQEIGEITKGYLVGNTSNFSIVSVSGYIELDGYKYRNFNGFLKIIRGKVYIAIVDINDTKDNFSSLSVKKIYISPFNSQVIE